MATLTTDQWIKKSIEKHGDRYDYSLSNYTGSKSKIKIICKIHGQFEIAAGKHTSKNKDYGHCQKCSLIENRKKLRSNKDEFVRKAIKKHGYRYKYDNVVYINATTKVSITCKKHGDFLQTPGDHIFGYGCQDCAGTKKSTTPEFVKKSKKVHGNKYNYSMVKYNGNKRPVKIICPVHGEFMQAPSDHLSGKGCKKCSEPKLEKSLARYDTYHERLESVGVECRRSPSNYDVLQVKCYRCKKWFIPKYGEVRHKISASNNIEYGESNLYCSDACKNSCPAYNFNPNNIDPKSIMYVEKSEAHITRLCQTDIVKQLQCGTDGKMHCEKCGREIFNMDAELHHTLPISKYGLMASDHESQMLLCVDCHIALHRECK